MKKLYYSLAVLLFVAAGCSNDDFMGNEGTIPVAQKRTTITTVNATIENADTRSLLVDGHKVVWQDGDAISVFSDEDWAHQYFISSGIGKETATFAGEEVSGTSFYALYPNSDFNLDQNNQEVSFYWSYNVFFGNETGDIHYQIPMFAKEKDGIFKFQQLGGLLHFSVTGKGLFRFAELRGNNGERFNWTHTLNYATEQLSLKPFDDGNSMDLIGGSPTAAEPTYLSDTEPVNVYFPVPAGMEFSKGITLRIAYEDEAGNFIEVNKTSDKAFTVTRGAVRNFPAFNVNDENESAIKKKYAPLFDLLEANKDTWITPDWVPEWSRWSIDNPVERWYNISWTDGVMEGIFLSGNGINTIPESIGQLTSLRYLDLNNNLLTSFPTAVLSLPNLEELNLQYNYIIEDKLSVNDFPDGFNWGNSWFNPQYFGQQYDNEDPTLKNSIVINGTVRFIYLTDDNNQKVGNNIVVGLGNSITLTPHINEDATSGSFIWEIVSYTSDSECPVMVNNGVISAICPGWAVVQVYTIDKYNFGAAFRFNVTVPDPNE